MSSMASMSALSSGTVPAGLFGGRARAPDRGQTALPYDAFATIDPLGDDDDDGNGYVDDDSTTSTTSSGDGNDYDRNEDPMGNRDGGGAYDDGRTGRRHGTDRGRKSALRGRDPYFGGIAHEAPTAGGDARGGLSADLGAGSSSSRFACPTASVQPDRRARHASGFGSVSRDMRRSSSGAGGSGVGLAAPPTSPMLMTSPLVTYERASERASRSARDHQADLLDARRAYVDAVDQLGQRQRAYEAEREERIRQMDAQANLLMAPLREAAADAEDRMRTAARALQRQFDRRLVELEADRTLTHEARAAQRAAVERARVAALHPDDLYERRQREASSAAGLLSMVDSLLGGIMGAGPGAPFVTVRMVPPPDASPMGLPPSSSSSASARRTAARTQSPSAAPASSSVRIEEID